MTLRRGGRESQMSLLRASRDGGTAVCVVQILLDSD